MKKVITFLILALALTFNSQCQTKYDKTITVIINDFSESCGEDPGDAAFCLVDEKGSKITERYTCNYENETWQVEPKDLITKDWLLNSKYKGKKATLYCVKSAGGSGWQVQKVEIVDASIVAAKQSDLGDVGLEKYAGFYMFNNSKKFCFSIGKFPENTKIKTEVGSIYLPLDKKFIGKYFLVSDFFSWETSKVTSFAGGYIAPMTGNIILGIDKDGVITIQNYDNYGKKGDVMDLNISKPGIYGRFIPRSDGHYDLLVNNAKYIWTKQ